MTTICSSCFEECAINIESGKFDANGPASTIKGNAGDVESSDCCGEPVEEIDADLWEYWADIKKLAAEMEVEYFISECDHESCTEAFENGLSAGEFINSKLPF